MNVDMKRKVLVNVLARQSTFKPSEITVLSFEESKDGVTVVYRVTSTGFEATAKVTWWAIALG